MRPARNDARWRQGVSYCLGREGESPMTVVEIVTTVPSALVLAIVHLIGLHRSARSMNAIQHSLSTRFIGQFPVYFPEILALVERANS